MTAVTEKKIVRSIMANCEITELVRRTGKEDTEFLTGTFDQYEREINGKPTSMYVRWNSSNPSVYDRLENALATGERIHLVVKRKPNNYVKKDKNGNEVIVDGKPLTIYGEQYEVLDIL